MTVSFCVVAYNEENALPSLLCDILNQTYQHNQMEIILVDSMSTDNTRKIMQEFIDTNHDFIRIVVKQNPKHKQSAGWNIAILEAKQDVIFRIDAHTSIPHDFVEKNMICIESGEFVSGGQRPCILDCETPWKKTLLLAENSMFGSSIAPFRRNIKNNKIYVKSMFHAAYRKEVFQQVGLFNESLGRTEDNEIHYRIRKEGFKLCFNPEIISYQHIRNTLRGMLKQKFSNGYWVGKTTGICPKCLSLYHFVPCCFILGILATSILAIQGYYQMIILMWTIYIILTILMSVIAILQSDSFYMTYFLMPFLFFLLHISYGVGTLIGLLSSFIKK